MPEVSLFFLAFVCCGCIRITKYVNINSEESNPVRDFRNKRFSPWTLETIFLQEANSLQDSITSAELQNLLKMENGKHFDIQLCDELVRHFGSFNRIEFDDFNHIWSNLVKYRSAFEHFLHDDEVSADYFQDILEEEIGQDIESSFFDEIRKFYPKQITLDVLIHSVHHLKSLTSQHDFRLLEPKDQITKFLTSIYPNDSDIISFTDDSSTLI